MLAFSSEVMLTVFNCLDSPLYVLIKLPTVKAFWRKVTNRALVSVQLEPNNGDVMELWVLWVSPDKGWLI